MKNGWPMVRAGDVLQLQRRWVKLDPLEDYIEIGVRSYGRGIFHKQPVSGASLGDKRVLRISPGDLVFMNVFAWEGAVGVAGPAEDGKIGSHRFATYTPKNGAVEPRFLQLYFQTEAGRELLGRVSPGSAGRNRTMNLAQFAEQRLPLPPIEEQRRIVARIEALAAKIAEARRVRAECGDASDSLYASARDQLFAGLRCASKPIGESFDLINGRAFKPDEWEDAGRKIVRIQNLKYPDARFNFFGGHADPKHIVRDGDVLFAWSGQVVSLGAHIWRGEDAILNQHIINVRPRVEMLPEFVKEGFNALVDEMKSQVRGLEMFHIRKREVDALLFPMAALAEQRRIVAYLDSLSAKAEALKSLQHQSAAELDALLPSLLDKAFRGDL